MNSKKKVTGTARGTIFSSKSTQKFYSPIFCRLMLYLCKLFLFTEYVIYTRSNILCFQSRHCDALISFPSVRKMRKTEQLSAEQQVLLRTLWIMEVMRMCTVALSSAHAPKQQVYFARAFLNSNLHHFIVYLLFQIQQISSTP